MKKFLGILVIGLLWCNISFAGWTKVAINAETGNLTAYIDKKTIKKTGNKVIFQQLNSYKEPISEGVYSDISYVKVNCSTNEVKFLASTFYSGKMGRGSVVDEDDSISDWEYFEPGSIMGIVIEYVCK